MAKNFTFEEVTKHNYKNDCWIIIHGKVYDVTPFLYDHPGGGDVFLVTAAEKDATAGFEEVGHSDSAIEMLEKYFVGEVDTSTTPGEDNRSPPPRAPPQAPAASNESSGFAVKILKFLLPLLILGLASVLQYYGKKCESATHGN